MNYDKVIIELLDRIKTLEEKVKILESSCIDDNQTKNNMFEKNESLIDKIKTHIQNIKIAAFNDGNKEIDLICREIQRDLGISNRVPSVCLAMKKCMQPNDVILHSTESGFSTSFSIKYYLDYLDTENNKIEQSIEGEKKILSLKQLRTGFEDYFYCKKPDYKYPGPLFGMAFYITKHDLGISLEQLFSKEISLNEYANILYNHFYELNPGTATVRTSAYKDAMKNLLEYAEDMHLENIQIKNIY